MDEVIKYYLSVWVSTVFSLNYARHSVWKKPSRHKRWSAFTRLPETKWSAEITDNTTGTEHIILLILHRSELCFRWISKTDSDANNIRSLILEIGWLCNQRIQVGGIDLQNCIPCNSTFFKYSFRKKCRLGSFHSPTSRRPFTSFRSLKILSFHSVHNRTIKPEYPDFNYDFISLIKKPLGNLSC